MPTTKILLLTAIASTALAGCKSGPARVCAKIDELAAIASTSADDATKTMAQDMKEESSTCRTRMKRMAEDDPEAFKKATACIEDATALKQVISCFFKARMGDDAKAKIKAQPGQ